MVGAIAVTTWLVYLPSTLQDPTYESVVLLHSTSERSGITTQMEEHWARSRDAAIGFARCVPQTLPVALWLLSC